MKEFWIEVYGGGIANISTCNMIEKENVWFFGRIYYIKFSWFGFIDRVQCIYYDTEKELDDAFEIFKHRFIPKEFIQ